MTAWNTSVVYGVRLADDDGWKIAFTRFPVLLVLGNVMSSGVEPLAVVLERDREMEDLDVGAATSSELVVPVCVGVGARELRPDVGRVPCSDRPFADLGLAGKDTSEGVEEGDCEVGEVNISLRRG